MATTASEVRITPRSWENASSVEITIPDDLEVDFRRQWVQAEAAKMIEDPKIAQRVWSNVGYSAGARLMAAVARHPSSERVDQNRNVSQMARSLALEEGRHLILVSPSILARASAIIPSGQFPIMVLDDGAKIPEAQQRLGEGLKVILSTPSVGTRWARVRPPFEIREIEHLHVATPVFHPSYLQGWRSALTDLQSTTLHPAESTWEESLAHRIAAQIEVEAKAGDFWHVIEHPTAKDLPRIPMGLTSSPPAIEQGLAKRLMGDLESQLTAAGRFSGLIAATLQMQKNGVECFGRRADATLSVLTELEPGLNRMVSGSKNLSLAL